MLQLTQIKIQKAYLGRQDLHTSDLDCLYPVTSYHVIPMPSLEATQASFPFVDDVM